MINCPTCVFADFDSGECNRLLIRLPHICPYSEERKPRNRFEMVKAMSMEQMAVWLAAIGPVPEVMLKFWRKWLKEEIADA